MIERDENGKLKVRRKPGRRATTGPTTETTRAAVPMVDYPTTAPAVRLDSLGRRIVRNEARICTARNVDGEPCRAYAIRGSTVCGKHGGSAPQVKAAAKVRLENAADRMAMRLLGMAESAESESVKLAAIRDALDRAGLSPRQAMDVAVEMPKFEQTIAKALRMVRPGQREQPQIVEAEVVDESEAVPAWHGHPKLTGQRADYDEVDQSERVGSHDDGEPVERVRYDPRSVRPPLTTEHVTLNSPGRAVHSHEDLYSDDPPPGTAAADRRAARSGRRARPSNIRH